jgi:hypothetical protein
MNSIKLKFICINIFYQTESDGDELFIKHKGKRIWPLKNKYRNVGKQPKISLAFVSEFQVDDQPLQFELWEYDNIFSSHQLGVFQIRPDPMPGGPFVTDMKLTSDIFAKYSLEWMITP